MNAGPMPLDRANGDVETLGDLRRRQVLPVRQVRDRTLAGAHRENRFGDRRVGVVILNLSGRSDLVLSTQPTSVRTPVLKSRTMNTAIQVGAEILDGRRGLQHVQNRDTENVGCVSWPDQRDSEPAQRLGVLAVTRLDLVIPPHTTMIPPRTHLDDTPEQFLATVRVSRDGESDWDYLAPRLGRSRVVRRRRTSGYLARVMGGPCGSAGDHIAGDALLRSPFEGTLRTVGSVIPGHMSLTRNGHSAGPAM